MSFSGVMRTVVWLLVIVAVAAIAWADPATGTVVISCNETDAELLVDGVLIPDRTPAVLTLPAGSHVIEVRKSPFVPQKKTVDVVDQQQVKLRFELAPPAPLPPLDAGAGSGSEAPAPTGSGAGSGSGSGAPHLAAAPPPPPPEHHCRQGGHEVPCPPEGPHCTMGGKLVSCATGKPLPPPPPPGPPRGVAAVGTGSGAGSAAPHEPQPLPGATNLEIATTVPHAIAYVDGAPVHEAPCALELEPGEHVIGVYAPGMIPAESIFKIETTRLRIELNPTQPRQRIDVPAQ